MQIVKIQVMFILRDSINVEEFMEQFENMTDCSDLDIIINPSISAPEITSVSYPDPKYKYPDLEYDDEIDNWINQATKVIDDELNEPTFRNLDENRYLERKNNE
jgi:hypothetical protein